MFPPDTLHINYLGPVNDALELLEKMYPIEMKEEFYIKHNMKKSGQGPGGKFNGPSIKYFLKEKVLLDLEVSRSRENWNPPCIIRRVGKV